VAEERERIEHDPTEKFKQQGALAAKGAVCSSMLPGKESPIT
jgi:hypothetical protein